jgi:hypothetical protein
MAERAEKQRDRFAQQMIEKWQTLNNPAEAGRMAQLHARESAEGHRADLRRDSTDEEAVHAKLLKTAEAITREQNRPRVDHDKDAHT